MNHSSADRVSGFQQIQRYISFFSLHRVVFLMVVLLAYTVLQGIAHWSLVLNENLMKWDIWDAYYPAGVFMTDAIQKGTLPLWNPLMLFGLPYYSIVGMPIWYPTTLLFSLIGYSPLLVNLEYVIHTIAAAFGAFLFIESSINKSTKQLNVRTVMAFLAGLLYANSTVFLSNAQHIMILVSATWMPYVLYYYRKYLNSYKLKPLMQTAVFAALSFYGGYPELFYCMFLFLIPYTLYFNSKKQQRTVAYVVDSAFRFIRCVLLTVMASAALMLPFVLSMSYLDRTAGGGGTPVDMNPAAIVTAFLPAGSELISGEASMGIYYIGLFCVVIFPCFVKSKYRDKWFYLASGAVFFIINLGDGNFFHSLMYRFLPMYGTFRFPTITRCFIALFLLLIAAELWSGLLEKTEQVQENSPRRWARLLFLICTGGFLLATTLLYLIPISTTEKLTNALTVVSTAFFYGALLYLCYAFYLKWLEEKAVSRKVKCLALCTIVCFEVLTVVYLYTPITVAMYTPVQASQKEVWAEKIQQEQEDLEGRNTSIDFSDSVRTYSALDSKSIVFEKTFDERGYLSFILASTQAYIDSYNNMITDENPVAYFTANVVNETVADLETWLNTPSVTPDQIFVENGVLPQQPVEPESVTEPILVEAQQADVDAIDNGYRVQQAASVVNEGTYYYKARVYLENTSADSVYAYILFNPQQDSKYTEGEFLVYGQGSQKYFEIYYPTSGVEYSGFEISLKNEEIDSVEILKMERTTESKGVTIDAFGLNRVEITVDAPQSGYLTLMQTKYPGWSVSVDGQPQEIATVNGNFMGVYLQEGEHHITFKFRPWDFFIGIGITAVFGIVFLAVVIVDYRKKHSTKRR